MESYFISRMATYNGTISYTIPIASIEVLTEHHVTEPEPCTIMFVHKMPG